MSDNKRGWIGVDLDGTLARYTEWKGVEHIGAPIPKMVARVKRWLAEGREVRIFTARVCRTGAEGQAACAAIWDWSKKHIGVSLSVTNQKDYAMIELWDDRAVAVMPNKGEAVRYTTEGIQHL